MRTQNKQWPTWHGQLVHAKHQPSVPLHTYSISEPPVIINNCILQFPEKLKYIYNDGTAKDISRYKGVCPCMVGPKMTCRKSQENQKMTILPWAMVHTARRNNHWAGCYGRVAYQSFFSTIDTGTIIMKLIKIILNFFLNIKMPNTVGIWKAD